MCPRSVLLDSKKIAQQNCFAILRFICAKERGASLLRSSLLFRPVVSHKGSPVHACLRLQLLD